MLEVAIEYNNPKEYFVVNCKVKSPIIHDARTLKSTELLWKISDAYSKYTEEFYANLIKHDAFETNNAYYTIYKAIDMQSKSLFSYVVFKFGLYFKPIGYNNLGDAEEYCQSFSYLPKHLSLEKFDIKNFLYPEMEKAT